MDFKYRSRANEDTLRYEWTIDKFSLCEEETGEAITSRKFSSKTNNKIQWWIELYPNGIDKETEGCTSVVLNADVEYGTIVKAKYVFSIITCKGKEINMGVNREIFSSNVKKGVHVKLLQIIDDLEGKFKLLSSDSSFFLFPYSWYILPDDKLTIACEVFALTKRSNKSGEGTNAVQVPECTIIDDLGRLLQDLQLSDVVLSTGEKEYKAHKAILATRSPVFAAMFQHKMKENISSKVNIADLEAEVLEEMLKFIYTGKVTKLEMMDDQLLVAADKYALKRLKALCEKSLCAKLSVDNAANAFVIADLHSAEVLKAQAMIFIRRHLEEIAATAGWEKMLIAYPRLVTELFRASLKH